MKKIFAVAACVMFLMSLVFPSAAPAQRRTVTIKLVSQVPQDTPWGELLDNMAAEWARITNNEVQLVVMHNVKAGEGDILRQLNTGQIQAAMLSTFGLKLISPEVMTLSCPFLIRTNEELDAVLDDLKPELEEEFEEKGYFTLAWSKVGWVRFFSKNPVFVPADLKRLRLGTSETEPELMDTFKAMGYHMVPIAMNQILVQLSGGQIDAVYQSPVNAGGYQIFGLAKNMASIPVAPFMGAIMMNRRGWRMIPARYRDDIIRVTRRMEAGLDSSVQALEAGVIRTMTDYGLVINQVSPQQEQLWFADFNRAMPSLVGTVFDREIYRRIEALLKSHRGER